MSRIFLLVILNFFLLNAKSQMFSDPVAKRWADSVYNTLNEDERIGQLIVARLSSYDSKSKKINFLYDQVSEYVRKYNIGGVCLFQGSPQKQAAYINGLKKLAKTPILFSIDGEWGVGMRLTDSVMPLPKQMMLGAVSDSSIIYQYGKIVAEQCKRLGIHLNYAPDVDVNNNPDNPVINDRSFGEDKYKVTTYGIQYMKGMQDNGVMACAKHFPGHGDVAVDSHLDLPVINKTRKELDSTELYPFREIFKAGVGSVMIGHLFIPAIDSTQNKPTSISKNNVEELLRKHLGFKGLAITDALEMQGVKKFFPNGQSSVEAIIAGNDMLCLPDSIPVAIEKIKMAIDSNLVSKEDIELHCKKVLMSKFKFVVSNNDTVNISNLTVELNKDVPTLRRTVAENAITLLAKQDKVFFPFDPAFNGDSVAYVGVGIKTDNEFSRRLHKDYNVHVFYFDYGKKNQDSIKLLIDSIVTNHRRIVIGIHNINRSPINNFGISNEAVQLVNTLQQKSKAITFLFGNAYAAKNWCFSKNLVLCYEDDSIVQHVALDMLQGKLMYKGKLPVTVCENFQFGFGLTSFANLLPNAIPESVGMKSSILNKIDSMVADGIQRKAMPGCVVLAAKDGKVVFQKGYGYYTYEKEEPVTTSSVYDLASVTKILAGTAAIMKLYDEGKVDLKKRLIDYLPSVAGTNKENITIEKLLLHEAGLVEYLPYYMETLDADQKASEKYYTKFNKNCFSSIVANDLMIRCDLIDTFYKRILLSPKTEENKYVYSDNDFIFLGKIIEQVSGLPLDEYVRRNFYQPMGLESIGYHPLDRISFDRIVPTEKEKAFRNQIIRGYVHDPGAAILGGVAGHAGLFSDAYDVASMMQMFLNGGSWNGMQLLKKSTVETFTTYQSKTSRRGLGFDKPEKDNPTRKEAYPALPCSAGTFGHTGFTGICTWADPEKNIIFVFLSNRIYPQDNGVFRSLNIRKKIFECIYDAASL